MHIKIEEKIQPTDNLGLFKKNMLFALQSPGLMCIPSIAAGPGFALLFAVLPFSILIVAPIVTAVQLGTRKKLSLWEYHIIIMEIEELNNEQFEEFIIQISKYKKHAQSTSSYALFQDLEKAEILIEKRMSQALTKEENRIELEKIREMKHTLLINMKDKSNHNINNTDTSLSNIKISYKLTKKDKEMAQTIVTKTIYSNLIEQKILDQKKIILDYFRDPQNAGKKTQHVIKTVLEHVMEYSYTNKSCHSMGL
ncbi:MAG: hypothetical protein HYX60_02390 [Legionella longbeachae]|nr:hypothetical protein [Legionella longbeachae]